ncbi:MAG: DUF6029 family protein [Bacteroidales bacterium]|nr:DUF6029 family protein [Bacteroidales bacterium]
MKNKSAILFFLITGFITNVSAQNISNNLNKGEIHGSFQADCQYYFKDTAIGASVVPEYFLMNNFENFIYTNSKFSAGFRFESYQNALKGFDTRNKGIGIPYRFASYKTENVEITVGNFYEQFGSGMILRAYEDWGLGFDNSIYGIRVKSELIKGITLKGLAGNQRLYFAKGEGIVRGADGEFSLNDIFKRLSEKKTRLIFGGSFVSKYQENNDPIYYFPENVAACAGRFNVFSGKINFYGEYVYKINDPSAVNNLIYKDGNAVHSSISYSQKGLGILISAKRVDNMDFRSERSATGNDLLINYLPALTKQHIYSLASMYPYATQPTGEMGFYAQVIYTVKKNTWLGGNYGTIVNVNYSIANSIDKEKVNDTTQLNEKGTLGYKSGFFEIGNEKYFEDFNVEITHKFSKKIKTILFFANLVYNKDVIEGHSGDGTVYANTFALDLSYKLDEKNNLRMELQHLYTEQDKGNWVMGLLEYTISPKWFFAVSDGWNYGNSDSKKQTHYYMGSFGFVKNATRIAINYGRQREGIICIGGVCRNVPSMNGITMSITSNF